MSVIIPTFRRPNCLRVTLNSFLQNHRTISEKVSFEILVVESDAIAETAETIELTRRSFAGLDLQIVHLKTEVFGYVKKVAHGLSHATGEYVVTLTDEDFTQYDFLGPILDHLNGSVVYPVLFTGSMVIRKVYAGGHPSYFRHGVPAFPHYVCSRALFQRLADDIRDYVHYTTDHHIPLLCWETGTKVVFAPEFLRVPPLVHVEAKDFGDAPGKFYHDAPVKTYDMSQVSRQDRRVFVEKWPLERKRRAVANMVDAFQETLQDADCEYRAVGCEGEVFMVLRGGNPLEQASPYYSPVTEPLTDGQISEMLSEERLSFPRWVLDASRKGGSVNLLTRVARRLRSRLLGSIKA